MKGKQNYDYSNRCFVHQSVVSGFSIPLTCSRFREVEVVHGTCRVFSLLRLSHLPSPILRIELIFGVAKASHSNEIRLCRGRKTARARLYCHRVGQDSFIDLLKHSDLALFPQLRRRCELSFRTNVSGLRRQDLQRRGLQIHLTWFQLISEANGV